MSEKCAILDCGGQYTKVIDRKVRELGVNTDIFPLGVDIAKLNDYQAIILSGGPSSVWNDKAPKYNSEIFDLNKPILGICYGMQLINEHFGGIVLPADNTEYGQIEVKADTNCPLFDSLDEKQIVLMSHGDEVQKLADGFKLVGETSNGVVAAIYNEKLKIAGVQFHPEVELTENGIKMLENFLRKICGLKEKYALEDRIQTSIDMIRKKVGDGKVVVLVSGGVDSAVTAALCVKALKPEQVYAIHIDHGMMRKNESDLICSNLADLGLTQMQRINAQDEFFNTELTINGEKYPPLCKTCDPEKKRAIIGHMFFVVTEEAAKKIDLDFNTAFLAQGTLRPDLIESGNPDVSGYAKKIKTHHNDVGVIRALRDRGQVVETNWDWHKDEVRQVARMLGLDEKIASRQPFPGPGLGVRIICADEPRVTSKDQLDQFNNYVNDKLSDYSAKIAPMASVGVQGDNRSYRSLAVLSGKKDYDLIRKIAIDMPNKLDFINRVAINLTDEDLGNMTFRSLHIGKEEADLLREIDAAVTDNIMNKNISQCFAVLLPFGCNGGYSAAIRAVVTSDFMTARPAIPGKDFTLEALEKAVEQIKKLKDIDYILYDLTGKPPATVEWE